MAFEPNVAPFITGDMNALQVFDSHLNPASIIRTVDPWRIRLSWDTSGLFIPLVNPGATWTINAYLESLGPGPEYTVASAIEAFGPPANAHNYTKELNIAGGSVPAGVYRLVCVLTLTSGGMPMPIAAFREGPVLNFFVG
jgi:hypothetical protein